MFHPTSAIARRIAAALLLIATMHVVGWSAYAERLNVTDQIEYIGNPYLDRYPAKSQTYARNIWDMIAFNGKLYLGAGNSSNSGPAPNAGPVPIISYDPRTNSFASEFVVDEEQVDVFHTINDQLYIPGNDPREGWDRGNFYTLNSEGKWAKHRNIPGAIHTYSLVEFQNKLFATIGSKSKASIVVSDDKGESWRQIQTASTRIYNIVIVNNKLYAVGTLNSEAILNYYKRQGSDPPISCYEYISGGKVKQRTDLSSARQFFSHSLPDSNGTFKISNVAYHGDKTVLIGAHVHNDHQSLPFGLFVVSSLDENNARIKNVALPKGAIPRDIYIDNKIVYVLLEFTTTVPREMSVYCSRDLDSWEEKLHFTSPAFARSFAVLNDHIYFSLGGEAEDPSKGITDGISIDTGKIFKIPLPD